MVERLHIIEFVMLCVKGGVLNELAALRSSYVEAGILHRDRGSTNGAPT